MKEKIEFSFNTNHKDYLNVKNNLSIILGHANSGKSYILNVLNSGLQGSKYSIKVNESKVQYGDYNVIYISDELSLDEDLKLNKTSYLKKYLLSYINNAIMRKNEYDNLEAKFEAFKQELAELINKDLFDEIFTEELGLFSNVQELDIEKYLEKLVNIRVKTIRDEEVEINKFSKSEIRKLWYHLLKNTRILDHKTKNIIIIDCPELYGGPYEWKWWGTLINDLTTANNICIIATMNPHFLKYLKWDLDSINIISNKNDKKIVNYHNHSFVSNYITIFSYLENKDYNDIGLFKDYLKRVILKEDYVKETVMLKYEFLKFLEIYYLKEKFYITNNMNARVIAATLLFTKSLNLDCLISEDKNFKYKKIFSMI